MLSLLFTCIHFVFVFLFVCTLGSSTLTWVKQLNQFISFKGVFPFFSFYTTFWKWLHANTRSFYVNTHRFVPLNPTQNDCCFLSFAPNTHYEGPWRWRSEGLGWKRRTAVCHHVRHLQGNLLRIPLFRLFFFFFVLRNCLQCNFVHRAVCAMHRTGRPVSKRPGGVKGEPDAMARLWVREEGKPGGQWLSVFLGGGLFIL